MKAPRSILVIQLRRIGDVILTTPAVAALKARYPNAAIDFLVEPPGAEALAGNPHIRSVLVYNPMGLAETLAWIGRVRRQGYDWVIDYLGNPRSALLAFFSRAAVRAGPAHAAHRWAYDHPLVQSKTTHYAALEKIRVLSALGVDAEGADFMPRVYFSSPAQAGDVVGLVPASRKVTRRWPAASYAALGRLLRQKRGAELLVFWGPGEKDLAEEVARGIGEGATVTEKTRTLRDAAELMLRCRLIITNCSGPKHLAVALGIPTVTVHASSDPASWNPPHPRHVVVRRDELPCIGCRLNFCPYDLECMQLSPERVFEAASTLLEPAA